MFSVLRVKANEVETLVRCLFLGNSHVVSFLLFELFSSGNFQVSSVFPPKAGSRVKYYLTVSIFSKNSKE